MKLSSIIKIILDRSKFSFHIKRIAKMNELPQMFHIGGEVYFSERLSNAEIREIYKTIPIIPPIESIIDAIYPGNNHEAFNDGYTLGYKNGYEKKEKECNDGSRTTFHREYEIGYDNVKVKSPILERIKKEIKRIVKI
jgi:hypothetical protein